MKWYYTVCTIVSLVLVFLGILLGYFGVLTELQSSLMELVGWGIFLALSIARVVEQRKK